MKFIPNFQLAETWEDVFMMLPNEDLVPAHHFNLHFEAPLKPFPIVPIWNKHTAWYLEQLNFPYREMGSFYEEKDVWNKCQWEYVAIKCEKQKQ